MQPTQCYGKHLSKQPAQPLTTVESHTSTALFYYTLPGVSPTAPQPPAEDRDRPDRTVANWRIRTATSQSQDDNKTLNLCPIGTLPKMTALIDPLLKPNIIRHHATRRGRRSRSRVPLSYSTTMRLPAHPVLWLAIQLQVIITSPSHATVAAAETSSDGAESPATFLFPTKDQKFHAGDTIQVTYISTFTSPILLTVCENRASEAGQPASPCHL